MTTVPLVLKMSVGEGNSVTLCLYYLLDENKINNFSKPHRSDSVLQSVLKSTTLVKKIGLVLTDIVNDKTACL